MSEHNLTTLELSNGFSSSSLKKQKLVDINQHSPKNAAPTYNLENAHKEENSAEDYMKIMIKDFHLTHIIPLIF
uniref:Uncharacterized protein n=1 Tax=Ditylenchus dipsaci TaxID=166011 RepID=A0A915CV93_9BILA